MKTSMPCTGMLSYENDAFKLSKTANPQTAHESRVAHGTAFCLQTSLPLTSNMNLKVAIKLYYIFS